MGYGGHLMLTPLARELKARYPDRPVVFVTRSKLWQRLVGRNRPLPVQSDIFRDNPHLTPADAVQPSDDPLYVYLDGNVATYWTKVTRQRAVYKTGAHAIDHICAGFGIEKPLRKCELFLSDGERTKAQEVARKIGPFIAIEPHANDEFTVNKEWGFERWQAVADVLTPECTFVQISTAGKRVLRGVQDWCGHLNFREAAALIGESRLFLGPEGGLMHAANAVGTRALIIFGGFISPDLTGYCENVNLYSAIDCAPCGLRRRCPYHLECMAKITPERVIAEVRDLLNPSGATQG